MKPQDKSIDSLHERIDEIESNDAAAAAADDSSYGVHTYYDEYYLDTNSEPPRFAYYRHIRVEQCTDEYRKKTFECVWDFITQDELDFYLKSKLRTPPEDRYKDKRYNWFFHDTSYSKRGLEAYDGQGCNGFTGCVPECRYYLPFGRIEDDEVIAEHKEAEEDYRKRNAIINIVINTEDFFEFARNFYNR